MSLTEPSSGAFSPDAPLAMLVLGVLGLAAWLLGSSERQAVTAPARRRRSRT